MLEESNLPLREVLDRDFEKGEGVAVSWFDERT